MKKIFLLLFLIFITSACQRNNNRNFTESDIVRIYVATELSTSVETEKIIQEYGLNTEAKRRVYYNALRELTDTPEKYDTFLEKVDQYKQQQFANSVVSSNSSVSNSTPNSNQTP